MLNKIIHIFIILILSLINSAYAQDLRILSSKDKGPIEGAVVYDVKQLIAYRSDFFGKVTVDENSSNIIQVKAKYHEPIVINLSQLKSAAIVMKYNQELLVLDQELVHSKEKVLWGQYSKYRANNDLLSYDLSIRVDPEKKYIKGNNKIRFKMLRDGSVIQIDLYENLNIDKILYNNKTLKFKL